jgi:hypothetical protein
LELWLGELSKRELMKSIGERQLRKSQALNQKGKAFIIYTERGLVNGR